jgi:iron(III) transport system substrate-binding protein
MKNFESKQGGKDMKRTIQTVFALTAAVGLLASASVTALAAGMPAAVQKLIPAAVKEAEATVFGTTMNPRQVKMMNAGFNSFYGTKIKLNQIGGRHTRKRVEVIRALKNQVPTGLDIFWTSSPRALINGNAIVKFNWAKEFGLSKDLMQGEYGIKTHDSYLTMVTINTKLVKAGDEPRTYDDLLKPKWKGKIAMPRSPSPWIYFSYAFGEEKAVMYLNTLLKQQNVKKLPRYPDVRSRIIAGEFSVGLGTEAWAEIRKGAPVKHPNMDKVILAARGAYIVKDSKSPNIAKLWGYWVVSPSGQKTIHDVRGYSLINTRTGDMYKYVQGKKVIDVPFDWRMQNEARLGKKFRSILRGKKKKSQKK